MELVKQLNAYGADTADTADRRNYCSTGNFFRRLHRGTVPGETGGKAGAYPGPAGKAADCRIYVYLRGTGRMEYGAVRDRMGVAGSAA